MNKRRDPEQDLQRLLEDDGGEFGAIYKRLPHPEPPRRLDQFVIANAARAVRRNRAPPAQRWLLGLGSAAGLVLAAGIAWQAGRQIESREAQIGADRSHRSVIAVEPITESTRLQKSVPPAVDSAMADKEVRAEAAQAKQESRQPARKRAMSPPPAPAVAPPPPAPAPEPEQTTMAAEPAPAMSAADEAQAFPEKKDNASSGIDSGAAGELRSERRDQAAGNAAPMSAPMAAEQSRAPSPNSSVKLRQNMHLAAQDWLAEIVRLKNAGHHQEAIENLRLFRRMHPDWQLSDELRRLSE